MGGGGPAAEGSELLPMVTAEEDPAQAEDRDDEEGRAERKPQRRSGWVGL